MIINNNLTDDITNNTSRVSKSYLLTDMIDLLSYNNKMNEEIILTKSTDSIMPSVKLNPDELLLTGTMKLCVKDVLKNINNNPCDIYGFIVGLFLGIDCQDISDNFDIDFVQQLKYNDEPSWVNMGLDNVYDSLTDRILGMVSDTLNYLSYDLINVFTFSLGLIDNSSLSDESIKIVRNLITNEYIKTKTKMLKANGILMKENNDMNNNSRVGRVKLNAISNNTKFNQNEDVDLSMNPFLKPVLSPMQQKIKDYINTNIDSPVDIMQIVLSIYSRLENDELKTNLRGMTKELGDFCVKLFKKHNVIM